MNVADLVRDALGAEGPICFPGLAARLAEDRWLRLGEAASIDRSSYGTARHLKRDALAPREELVRIGLPPAFGVRGPVLVETLSGAVRDRYVGLGLDFHLDGALDAARVGSRLDDALRRIADVPAAAAAVGSLLSTLHVVRPESPEHDVSYSDPILPFSIFVGVDGASERHGDLRLAEGMLHECMHLQLTLMEDALPMVVDTGERLRSPWQGTMRPIQGVLHGLFVFRVIQWFHRTLIEAGGLADGDEAYLRRRVDLIEEEAGSVRDLARSRDLTPAGRRLASRLIAGS